ncbi:MAG: DUF6391 domain-containing protein [Aggregatilineales bacterium]
MLPVELIAKLIQPVLELTIIRQVRRNHALEHATIHMLNRQHYTLSGRASAGGFVMYGNVPEEKVILAVEEALTRLRRGESNLAMHPNCGTNLVTTGFLLTLIGAGGFVNTKPMRAWERFPLIMILMMITTLYSQPIGMSVQKHITTEGHPGDLELVTVTRTESKLPFRDKPIITHHIITRRG